MGAFAESWQSQMQQAQVASAKLNAQALAWAAWAVVTMGGQPNLWTGQVQVPVVESCSFSSFPTSVSSWGHGQLPAQHWAPDSCPLPNGEDQSFLKELSITDALSCSIKTQGFSLFFLFHSCPSNSEWLLQRWQDVNAPKLNLWFASFFDLWDCIPTF